MTIRLLTAQDAPDYQILRLRALQTDPVAFLSTFDSESDKQETSFAHELAYAYAPPFFGYYGAFEGERLMGFCLVTQSYLNKQDHVAFLYNLYVDPAFRGQRVGTQLVTDIMDRLSKAGKIERIFLSCTAKNKSAVHFYKAVGFQRCGIRPRSVKWENTYDDEIEMVKVIV